MQLPPYFVLFGILLGFAGFALQLPELLAIKGRGQVQEGFNDGCVCFQNVLCPDFRRGKFWLRRELAPPEPAVAFQ